MEKRRHHRFNIRNLTVDASDGVGFLQGAVADISRFGVRVNHLQQRKGRQPQRMTFIISGHGESFKMTVRPRWSILQGAGKSVGAEIIDPSWRWTEFIMNFEPEASDLEEKGLF